MSNGALVLIVDDDPGITSLLSTFLEQSGFSTATASSSAEMREILVEKVPDIIVLDLMMPGEDGLTALRKLQASGGPPVIMLSAMSSDVDRIVGLEIGAEDFVQKPCNPRELVARIRTVLRRVERQVAEVASAAAAPVYRFADWRLDTRSRTLFDPTAAIVNLSDGEYRMLLTLVERPSRVLSRDQLMDYAIGADCDHFDRTIDVQVSRLRKKLSGRQAGEDLIRTVRGEGYMFVQPVRRLSA